MSALLLNPYRHAATFDPETDITWNSLFWAEGTDFVAQGYSDTDTVTNWPNETSEPDLSSSVGTPTFDAVNASFNNRPVVAYSVQSHHNRSLSTFTDLTGPYSYVYIGRSTTTDENNKRTLGSNGAYWLTSSAGTGRLQHRDSTGGVSFYSETDLNNDTDAHVIVMVMNGSSSKYIADGTDVTVGTPISTQENFQNGTDGFGINATTFNTVGTNGQEVALVGVYDGDFTADSAYDDFNTWAEDHYGVTIA